MRCLSMFVSGRFFLRTNMASKNIVFKKVSKDKSVSGAQVFHQFALEPPEASRSSSSFTQTSITLLFFGVRWPFIWERGTLWITSTVWTQLVSGADVG